MSIHFHYEWCNWRDRQGPPGELPSTPMSCAIIVFASYFWPRFFLGLPILFLCCEMCNFLARRYTNAGRRGNPMQLIFVGWEVLLRTALFCAHICTWSPFFKAMTIEQSTCCGAEKTLMRIKKAVLCKRWKLIFCWLSKRKKIL